MFKLDPRLEADSVALYDFPLSQLRLLRDGELEWFILIPKKNNIVEITDLSVEEQVQLIGELNCVITKVKKEHEFKKINFAALGNMVSQFHLHIIFRQENDRAWPGAIWGSCSQQNFDEARASYWMEIFNE